MLKRPAEFLIGDTIITGNTVRSILYYSRAAYNFFQRRDNLRGVATLKVLLIKEGRAEVMHEAFAIHTSYHVLD